MLSRSYRQKILSARTMPTGQTIVELPPGEEVDFSPTLEPEAKLSALNYQAEAEAAKRPEIELKPANDLERALIEAVDKILEDL